VTYHPPKEQEEQLERTTPAEAESVELHSANEPITSEADQTASSSSLKSWFTGGRGVAVGIGLGVILTLGGTRLLGSAPEPAAVTSTETETQGTVRSVTTQTLVPESVDSLLSATGTVQAFELVPVKTQQSGYQIEQVVVEEGDRVEKGQLLARIDRAVLQGQYDQARAALAQAEARLAELRAGTRIEEIAQAQARLAQAQARLAEARASIPRQIDQAQAQVDVAQARLDLAQERYGNFERLADQGAISRDRFNEIRSEFRSAEANLVQAQQRLNEARNTNTPGIQQLEAGMREARSRLEQLQTGTRPEVISQAQAQLAQAKAQLQTVSAQLEDTRILAPVSGIILERNAKVGDVPSSFSDQALFTIIEDGRLELHLKVPETQLTQIETGQKVLITSNRDVSLQLTGTVREIDPLVAEDSRQATIKVDIPARDNLQPGMFLQGEIITDSETGLAVPAKAVLPQSGNQATVFVVQPDNTVKAVTVEVGELLPNDTVEILSGLVAGNEVVVKGAAYLKDGDKITVNS
jgi:HlyD family secretion protein